MSFESKNRCTLGVGSAARMRYGFETPRIVAGTTNGVPLIAVGGVSAEASLVAKMLATNATRKQSTPMHGQVPLKPSCDLFFTFTCSVWPMP